MGKYISLGEYNKLYKYIWIYLSIRFVTLFIFNYKFVFEQIQVDIVEIPYTTFISQQVDYLGFFIISSIMKIIKSYRRKKKSNRNQSLNQIPLIYNKTNIVTNKVDYFLFVNIFLVVAEELFYIIISTFQCSMLDYWMFKMLFLELFNSRLFDTKIYIHHILSLIFILSTCSLIKSISIILSFSYETDDIQIFNERKWLIPLGVIIYLLLSLFSGYLHCNEKYYLEKN